MHELCSTLDSFWFPAHLLDLLYHGEQLEGMGHGLGPTAGSEDGFHQQSGARLREFLLLEYATSLMGHHSLWQVGANYLDHCPTQGKQRLQLLLERIPLDSEIKAEKVIAAASKRGFMSIVASASKVMGLRELKCGKIGSAMSWALRSQVNLIASTLSSEVCL
jgi:nuclear pore complex protein Nup85